MMNDFDAIAIVGQGCVLPKANDPHELWQLIVEGRSGLSTAADGDWGNINPNETPLHGIGGRAKPVESNGLDPLFHWLEDALLQSKKGLPDLSSGIIMGHLSYPTRGMNRLAEQHLLEGKISDEPLNRFMSGYPVHRLAKKYQLDGSAFCLDAACASSLYAIKLACDALHRNETKIMFAGGINAIDDLFLHSGFTELQAISLAGHSRPFDQSADGLLPATGVAMVALMRLQDAEQHQLPILGVIKGIGLSNDGKQGGLLSPAKAGQVRAMQQAYQSAGLLPQDIQYIECHATGTPVGDRQEIESLAELYQSVNQPVALSSLKSNLGHLVTAAGGAGLIKILQAFKHKIKPATIGVENQIEILANRPFEVLTENTSWADIDAQWAALSAFGFGGNNAHLIVGSYAAYKKLAAKQKKSTMQVKTSDRVAVVGMHKKLGQPDLEQIKLSMTTAIPPKDLQQLHGEQLMILFLVQQALNNQALSLPNNTGVYIGIGTGADAARYYTRMQASEELKDSISPKLNATRTLGCMPNVPANRINALYDFIGASFTCSAEELSGIEALKIAYHALQQGEIEAAIVGAVDLPASDFDRTIFEKTFEAKTKLQDGAAIWILKTEQQAKADGDQILAVIDEQTFKDLPFSSMTKSVQPQHAASGLLSLMNDESEKDIVSFSGYGKRIKLQDVKSNHAPKLYCYSGKDRVSLLKLLESGENNDDLNLAHKLAILVDDVDSLSNKKQQAITLLKKLPEDFSGRIASGMFYSSQLIAGKVGFTFPSSAGAYQGMGVELIDAFPKVMASIESKLEDNQALQPVLQWLRAERESDNLVFDKLKASLFLSIFHGELSQSVSGIQADGYIGFSAGETAALFVSGVWRDLNQYYQDVEDSQIWTQHLAGEFSVLNSAWPKDIKPPYDWQVWGVHADVQQLQSAIAQESLAHITTSNALKEHSICGDASACERVAHKLGQQNCQRLHYDLIHHCPEMKHYQQQWLALTTRTVYACEAPIYGVYQNGQAFKASSKTVPQALLAMATQTVNYPQIIEQAYQDGFRIFIEHGARSSCSSYIDQILAGKPHLAVSLDGFGRNGVKQFYEVMAQLFVVGVPMAIDSLRTKEIVGNYYPLHMKQSKIANQIHQMPFAPMLPPIMSKPDMISPHQNSSAPTITPELASQTASTKVVSNTAQPNFLSQLAQYHQKYLATQGEAFQRYLKLNQQIIANIVSQPAPEVAVVATSTVVAETAPAQQVMASESVVADKNPEVAQPSPIVAPQPATISKGVNSLTNRLTPKGVTFDREQLKIHAWGNISDIFGEQFKQQDQYDIQVRMPADPMLLADRVVGMDAEPGSLGLGIVWTETDITKDVWFTFHNRILPGMMIECGQADLFLISYLGIDFKNKGERAYRLLGCEVSFMAPLPKIGDTLHYQIHIDSHAIDGNTHLFFFHYDCYVGDTHVLKVRNGQAGFFSRDELDDSKGVLWDPASEEIDQTLPLAKPKVMCNKSTFSHQDLLSFSQGDLVSCFGDAFSLTQTHTRTPCIPGGNLLLLDEITEFDIYGGPWQRGYMKGYRNIQADDWFFEGHFKNDPCMPGTLMTEMAFQCMSVYLTAMGYTIDKDGWTFSPMIDESVKLACRGQVLPTSKKLTIEIFVREIRTEPEPVLYADIISTIDGLKALYAQKIHLRLMPDYPCLARHQLSDKQKSELSQQVALIDNVPCDEKQAQDCAWGKPSEAFGSLFIGFDNGKRLSRLPGDPYMFISRMISVDGGYGKMQQGSHLVAQWDISADNIFFKQQAYPTLPLCVIQEAVLQPCGWLSCYMGAPLQSDQELFFRNLDGKLTLYKECLPYGDTLESHVKNTSVSIMGNTIIVAFTVTAFIDGEKVLDLDTVFGYFTAESLAQQVGLPMTEAEKTQMVSVNEFEIDLTQQPASFFDGSLSLPQKKLCMLDKLDGYWPEQNTMRGVKWVKADEWFFKAHFFQDPVQPGSLGIEALVQLLQSLIIVKNLADDFIEPRFEPLALNQTFEWRYRGQVIPSNKQIQSIIEIEDIVEQDNELLVIAKGSLWCDGLKIYDVKGMGMRVKETQWQTHAMGKVSDVFDAQHAILDNDEHRLRLPAKPFLLFDRVSQLDLSDKPSIEVALTIQADAWYLLAGNLHPALLMEAAGQAGIYLCSALGNERVPQQNCVYRIAATSGMSLLATEQQLKPAVGSQLTFKVAIKQQYPEGERQYVFFNYQCFLDGQCIATVETATACILPYQQLLVANDAPQEVEKHQIDQANVLQPKVKTIELVKDKVWHLDAIEEIAVGHLKASKLISADDWYFKAHFKNDPCMPAALISAACFECLRAYQQACGFIPSDWPSVEKSFDFSGYGQVTPDCKKLTFELFQIQTEGEQMQVEVLVKDENRAVLKTRFWVLNQK